MVNPQVVKNTPLPSLPHSWSELTWKQLTQMWTVKLRYGGNPDVSRAAACLALLDVKCEKAKNEKSTSVLTGESIYILRSADGRKWTVTPREISYIAKKDMPWFDYPYGDPGEKAEHDKNGNVIKERREPVSGYVSPMRDAMVLPVEKLRVEGSALWIVGEKRSLWRRFYAISSSIFNLSKTFALPRVACNNLTWQQYRSLQAIVPQLFSDGVSEADTLHMQAQFLAHCLAPRSFAILDTIGGSIRLRPHWEYKYNAEQAEELVRWWEKRLSAPSSQLPTLFHIIFQVYQTSMQYYSAVYPLLFQDSGKTDPLRDALTGEVGTINTVMKYAGYAEQQQVYDSDLPFVFDILNTMTKEAKEVEKMNTKIKKK